MYPIQTLQIKPQFRLFRMPRVSWETLLFWRRRERELLFPTWIGWAVILVWAGLIVEFVETHRLVYYTSAFSLFYALMVSIFYAASNVQKIDARVFSRDGALFARQPACLVIELFNHKRKLPFLGGKIWVEWMGRRTEVAVPIIGPQSRMTLSLPVQPPPRGRQDAIIRGLASTAPFHTMFHNIQTRHRQPLLVYPSLVPLQLHPSLCRAVSRATMQNSRAQGSDEFSGLRHFQAGDALQRIHWKNSAKHDKLLIQQHTRRTGNQALRIALCSNPLVWTPEAFEHACSLLFSMLWEPAVRSHVQGVYLNHAYCKLETQQQLFELVGWLSMLDLRSGGTEPPAGVPAILPHPTAHAALYDQQSILAIPAP